MLYQAVMFFLTRLLNTGITATVINIERTKAKNANRTDSTKNCFINCERSAPTTFRKPVSLALLRDRTVERFMKLKQAIIRISKAMPASR